MKIREILTEGRDSPIYHYTLESQLFKILKSNTLMSRGGKIYFTRDYNRQFSPHNILKGTWGIRINQSLLYRKYGNKLQAGGQAVGINNKKREELLKDPEISKAVDNYIKNNASYNSRVNGVDIRDLIKGTIGLSSRWESEEWLLTNKLENLDQYITGIVYSGGKNEQESNFGKRSANPNNSLEKLALELMTNFSNKLEWEKRDWLFKYMTDRNIPFVYHRIEFSARQVKSKMFELWKERKEEKERRSKENSVTWIIMRNPSGGGVAYDAPDGDPIFAAKRALKDKPTNFPDGIFGVRNLETNDAWMFEKPYIDIKKEPVIKSKSTK